VCEEALRELHAAGGGVRLAHETIEEHAMGAIAHVDVVLCRTMELCRNARGFLPGRLRVELAVERQHRRAAMELLIIEALCLVAQPDVVRAAELHRHAWTEQLVRAGALQRREGRRE